MRADLAGLLSHVDSGTQEPLIDAGLRQTGLAPCDPVVDEERGRAAGPRDAPDEEGQPVHLVAQRLTWVHRVLHRRAPPGVWRLVCRIGTDLTGVVACLAQPSGSAVWVDPVARTGMSGSAVAGGESGLEVAGCWLGGFPAVVSVWPDGVRLGAANGREALGVPVHTGSNRGGGGAATRCPRRCYQINPRALPNGSAHQSHVAV